MIKTFIGKFVFIQISNEESRPTSIMSRKAFDELEELEDE